MKDWFYEKFVRKNPRAQKAYETYVQAHLEEHRQSRLKHWLVLLALSWKYRKSQIPGRRRLPFPGKDQTPCLYGRTSETGADVFL